MQHKYPQDADGDSLRRVQSHDSDMSKPMEIDFAVAVSNEANGLLVQSAATAAGYTAKVWMDAESKDWTCYCTKSMIPSYDAIIQAQSELAILSKPFGGYDDGWGTFGNADPIS